jgi:hypothetical protein
MIFQKSRSSLGIRLDRRRSRENWERGRGAKKKGNPRYRPVKRNGRKVYILRK